MRRLDNYKIPLSLTLSLKGRGNYFDSPPLLKAPTFGEGRGQRGG